MALLTASRMTNVMGDDGRRIMLPVEANTTIFLGSMVAVDANGYAVPAQPLGAAPLNQLRVVGRCDEVYQGIPGQDAVNVAPVTSGAAGAISVIVRRGVFHLDNDGTITAAMIGQPCFSPDDHSASAGTVVAPSAVTIGTTPAGTIIPLAGRPVVWGTVVVQNAATNPATVYQEGRDYVVDYTGAALFLPPGTTIAASSTIYVGYTHGGGKPLAGSIVQVDALGVWVDTWHMLPMVAA